MKNKKTIKFGSKSLTFFFGLSFVGEFLENEKMTLDEIDERLQSNPFKFLPKLMHESYKHGLLRQGKEANSLDYWQFVDLIDENGGVGSKKVQEFIQGFTNSLIQGVPQQKSEEDSKKK